MTGNHPQGSAAAIRDGLHLAEWAIGDLWMAALGIGGNFSTSDISRIASGQLRATPTEHDILATALNEHFLVRGQNHPVRYWRDLPTPPIDGDQGPVPLS